MWVERYSRPPAARCGQRGRACAKYTLIRQKTGKSGDGRRSNLAQGIKRYTRKALPEKHTMSPCNDNDKSVMFLSGAGGSCNEIKGAIPCQRRTRGKGQRQRSRQHHAKAPKP